MIKQIKFVSVATADQDRALAFWTENVGFEIRTDQPFDDQQRWIELGIPGADTALVLFTPPGTEDQIGGFSNLSFQCDDIQATYNVMKARGVEFLAPPETQEWGSSAQFKDPDGNVFLISSR